MATDQNQYLGNPNLKKANVPVEFTKGTNRRISKVYGRPCTLYTRTHENCIS